ncbi:MAG TPA: hypothetical protein VGC41_09090 [Kofleriaceae bacterium]
MRWATVLLMLAGCRQILGLEDPTIAIDAAFDAKDHLPPDATMHVDAMPGSADWPCGMKPTAPSASHDYKTNGALTDAKLSGITIANLGTLATVAAGAPVRIQFKLEFTDTSCSTDCLDQFEVGFNPTNHRAGCAFDQAVKKQNGTTVDIDNTAFEAPTTPGVYELRAQIAQNLSCTAGGTTDWYAGNAPPIENVLAMICVQ